jgi:predicted DNA-binding protein (UPF0251 family)
MSTKLPSTSRLKRYFDYCPDTNVLTPKDPMIVRVNSSGDKVIRIGREYYLMSDIHFSLWAEAVHTDRSPDSPSLKIKGDRIYSRQPIYETRSMGRPPLRLTKLTDKYFNHIIKGTRITQRVADALYDVFVEGFSQSEAAHRHGMHRAQVNAGVKRVQQEMAKLNDQAIRTMGR